MTRVGRQKFISAVNKAIDELLKFGLSDKDTDKLHAVLQSVFTKLEAIENILLSKKIKRELKK